MKNVLTSTIAAVALTAMFAGPAAAAVSKGQLSQAVNSSIGSNSNVTVHEKNGVVTISGYYNDFGDKVSAMRAAEQTEGVVKVINLARTSS